MSSTGSARARTAWRLWRRPRLSVVIVAYNMARELPRTLQSLSPAMQRGIAARDYEVVVVDNGSTRPADTLACRARCPGVRLLRAPGPNSPSPVAAVNHGLANARGDLIGVWIDGARLASPGILHWALQASRLHRRPVIGSLGLHLGPDVQMRSIRAGYDQAQEDRLLAESGWTRDGYRLFGISSFAGSCQLGWFGPIAESNALFMTRAHWRSLGGYDARFQLPGGGLANLDIWRRACSSADSQVILLLGEGTFHQVHGGVATNSVDNPYPTFDTEYQRIRGARYQPPAIDPWYLGQLSSHAVPALARSATLVSAAAQRETPGIAGVSVAP